VAAGVGLLGCILPWLKVEILFFSQSENGLNDWCGWAAMGGLVSAGAMAVMGADRNKPVEEKNKKMITLGGGAALVFPLLYIIRVMISDGSELATYGIGLFITIIAGIAVLAIPFVIKDDGNFSMPTKDSLKADVNKMKEGTPLE